MVMEIVTGVLLGLAFAADTYFLFRLFRRGAKVWFYVYLAVVAVTDFSAPLMHFAARYFFEPSLRFYDIKSVAETIFVTTVFPKILLALGLLCDSRRRGNGFTVVGAVLAIITFALPVVGYIQNRHGIVVNRIEVCSPELPKGFDGVRVAFFSDIHVGTLPNAAERLQALVDSVNNADCLFAVNGGDVINRYNDELTPDYMRILSGISCPVYSVMGNHDCGYYVADTLLMPMAESTVRFKAKIDSVGWNRLDDRSEWVYSRGDSIVLTGLEFKSGQCKDRHRRDVGGLRTDLFRTIPDGAYNMVLSHLPQYWHKLVAEGAGDLTLSGHVHAMQFKMRLFGRELSPASVTYREWSGLYNNNGKILYITDGIGYSDIPIRLGAKSGFAVITLRRCE